MLRAERVIDLDRRCHRGIERIVPRIALADQTVDRRAALRVQHNTGNGLAAELIEGFTCDRFDRSIRRTARMCIRRRRACNGGKGSRQLGTVAVRRRHRCTRLRCETRDLELSRIGIADRVGEAGRIRHLHRNDTARVNRIVRPQCQDNIGGRRADNARDLSADIEPIPIGIGPTRQRRRARTRDDRRR